MSAFHFLAASASALWRERAYSPTGLARLQRQRLGRLVAHAAEHVQLYRNLYAGIDPASFELTDLPPVERSFLMDHFDDSIAFRAVNLAQVQEYIRHGPLVGRLGDGSLVLSVAGGMDGPPGYFVTDRRGWDQQRGTLVARLMRHHLLNPWHVLSYGPWRRYRMAFLAAPGPRMVTQLAQHYPGYTRLLARGQVFTVDTPVERLCRELTALAPHHLHGYPSFLQLLAHEQGRGRLRIFPRFISLGSEPFSGNARAALQVSFPGAEIMEVFGSTECMGMAMGCRHGRLHVNEDVCILENVDAAGYPVPEGKPGARGLVTNLLNFTQPIIRYELADQIVLRSDPCPCGFPFRTLEVLGRVEDVVFLRTPDGQFQPHAPVPLAAAGGDIPGLRQHQVVHDVQNQLRVVYVRDSAAESGSVRCAVQERYARYLERHGLQGAVTVMAEEVGELPRDPDTRKLRRVVSRVPRPGPDQLPAPWAGRNPSRAPPSR